MPNGMSSTLRVLSRITAAATGTTATGRARTFLSWLQLRIGAAQHHLARHRAIRQSIAELEAMDEHMLRDIGLENWQMPRTAWFECDNAEPWRTARAVSLRAH
jgi:uncharacterized protein YjiS (DUF1127 family)